LSVQSFETESRNGDYDQPIEKGTSMLMSDDRARVKLFLNRNSRLYWIALIMLVAGALAQAAVFGTPTASFNTYDSNCNYANYSGGGSITGSVTNGGSGVTLSGNDSFQGYSQNGVCYLGLNWQGTGSGGFSGTTTVTPNFTLTVPADVTITCSLTVTVNGTQEAQFNCGESSPGGTYSLAAQNLPVPATLSSYAVQLLIVATWSPNAVAPYSTVSVNVQPHSSIDILSPGGGAAATPAPPALMLAVIGIVFLSLIAFGIQRRKLNGGFPATRP
jgi:hypothetical protein